jgi:hypothetical protein
MHSYTARNGTTFQYEPGRKLQVTAADNELDGATIELDMEDVLEFVGTFKRDPKAPTDADCAAVSGD